MLPVAALSSLHARSQRSGFCISVYVFLIASGFFLVFLVCSIDDYVCMAIFDKFPVFVGMAFCLQRRFEKRHSGNVPGTYPEEFLRAFEVRFLSRNASRKGVAFCIFWLCALGVAGFDILQGVSH